MVSTKSLWVFLVVLGVVVADKGHPHEGTPIGEDMGKATDKDIYPTYDFVIVGGGSAGCVLASRLSENPNWQVYLIDAGGEDLEDTPPGIPLNSSYHWPYSTIANEYSCLGWPGQSCSLNKGKIVGGSGATGHLMYCRGHHRDYDDWVEYYGCDGWGYRNVLDYFKKSENNEDNDIYSDEEHHGKGGYQHVKRYEYEDPNVKPLVEGFLELGLNKVDFNGKTQEGVMVAQFTQKNNTRCSPYSAFVKPIYNRPNLIVVTDATDVEIIINPKTKTAMGVKYTDKHGKKKNACVSKEVIVSCGTIRSPCILMKAGIGPKKVLDKMGVKVLVNRPVGKNFQDHISFEGLAFTMDRAFWKVLSGDDINTMYKEWLQRRTGLLGSVGPMACSAFIKCDKAAPQPEIQCFIETAQVDFKDTLHHKDFNWNNPHCSYNAINIYPVLLKPKSIGFIECHHSDHDRPLICGEYLSDDVDTELLVDAAMLVLQFLKTKPMRAIGAKLLPVDCTPCVGDRNSRSFWRCVVKQFTKSVGHSGGTCKMGQYSDHTTVVNCNLQVHDVQRLRVIDSSVMPTVASCVSHAPTLMIAEKGADILKAYWQWKDDVDSDSQDKETK